MMKYYLIGAKNGHNICIEQIKIYLDELMSWGKIGYPYFLKCSQWLTNDQFIHLKKLKHDIKRPFKYMPTENDFKDIIINFFA